MTRFERISLLVEMKNLETRITIQRKNIKSLIGRYTYLIEIYFRNGEGDSSYRRVLLEIKYQWNCYRKNMRRFYELRGEKIRPL